MLEALIDIATGTFANILAAAIVAVTAFVFRKKLRRIFRSSVLKSKNSSPNMTLEVDSARNTNNEWVTHFLIENTGEIEIADIRIYLCTHSPVTNYLTVERIKIDSQKKWINSGGHRLQIDTRSLHDGCNVTQDQRYFVEFIDDNDGTIYRLSRGAPSAKDGSMAHYGTTVCRKRLPRRGIRTNGTKKIKKAVGKYDIDLALG